MPKPLDLKHRPRERAPLKTIGPSLTPLDMRVAKLPPKTADEFYLSPAWRGLVAAIKRERGNACEECGRSHDHKGKPLRIIGDHIKELKDGGAPLDRANIKLMCLPCHNRKTADEKARRLAR